MPRWIPLSIYALTLLAFLGLAWKILAYRQSLIWIEQEEIRLFQEASTEGTRHLDAVFRQLQAAADQFARRVENGSIGSETLIAALQDEIASQPSVRSLGIAFGPYEYASDTRLFARGFTRTDQGLEPNEIDASENYLEPTPPNAWFTIPMEKGPSWIEPYFDPIASLTIIEYCAPFYRVDAAGRKRAVGVVYADLSMEDVRDILGRIDLGRGGYGMLLSKGGRYVTHPLEEYADILKPALDDPMVKGNPNLKAAYSRAIAGERFYQEFLSPLTRKASMLYFQPIPVNGWPFGVVSIKDFDLRHADFIRQQLISLTMWSMLFLLLLFVSGARVHDRSEVRLWLVVTVFALLAMISIGVVWYLALHFTPYRNDEFVEIPDHLSLKKIQQQMVAEAHDLHLPEPATIPTGFFIQSVNFETANDVKLTGLIWQKYTIGQHDGLTRGVDLPEATDLTMTERYRRREGNVETIGWSFAATLRQQFDYSRYPLDNKDVWIRTLHADFGKNVVLIPDLEAYPILNPTSHPGIEEDIVLQGWDLDSSFFSFVYNSYNTDFGLPDSAGKSLHPELYFTVVLRRNFLAPFVTYVLPILIIACILFTVLLMSTRDEKKNEMFQFSITGVIGTCSGLFFSVLVAHSQLRGAVAVNEFMYLEYFCFVLYIAILGVACNAFLFGLDTRISLVRQGDNLIPKLLYWPILMGSMLLLTIRTFF